MNSLGYWLLAGLAVTLFVDALVDRAVNRILKGWSFGDEW